MRGFTFSRMKLMVASSGVPGPKMAATPLSFRRAGLRRGWCRRGPGGCLRLFVLGGVGNARDDDVVCAGEDGETDAVDVFLDGSGDDHFGGLAKAGVDDLHAGITQSTGDDFGAAIVAVEAGFCDEYADRGLAMRSRVYVRQRSCASLLRNVALTIARRLPCLRVLPACVGGVIAMQQEALGPSRKPNRKT